MKIKKTLEFGDHGFIVRTDLLDATALPNYNCKHLHFSTELMRTMKDVIQRVETIRQPLWVKVIKLRKFHISIVRYE